MILSSKLTGSPLWRAWLMVAIAAWMIVAPQAAAAWTPVAFQPAGVASAVSPPPLRIYLYANANPVMGWDPSGNFDIRTVAATVYVQAVTLLLTYPRVFAVAGLIANVLIPEEVDQAMLAAGVPGYAGLSAARQGELKLLKFIKKNFVTEFLTNKLRGILSNRAGKAFENFMIENVFKGAERQITTGRRVADALWKGRLLEIKSGVSFSAREYAQLREFSAYAKNNSVTFTYVFLSSPSQTVVDAIEKVGGRVISIF